MTRDTGVPATPSDYSAEPEPSCTVSAVPVSIPNAVELVTVPRDAPLSMWDGLPRIIMLWMSFDQPTPRKLFDHMRWSGFEVPDWMREEGELKALDHVPSKGTRCVLIYRAMVENWLAASAIEAQVSA